MFVMENHLNEPKTIEIIDVEEYAKKGEVPAKGMQYQIRVDKEHYVVDVHEMTGCEILLKADKNPPERFRLDQKLKGGATQKIDLNDVVDLTTPGLERFMTLPLDQTEGEMIEVGNLRCDFDLPEEDREYLDARGIPWETVTERQIQWLLIRDFPIPEGYNHRSVTAAIRVTTNYPTAGLDMVYFHPSLARVNGIHIGAIQGTQNIDSRTFQQWSRHRTGANPWRAGLDNISTHLGLVEEWLLREFGKQ